MTVHFHHEHDADPCHRDHGWPDYVHALLATINRMESAMTEAQSHLDADVQALTDGLSVVEQEIADLKAQPQAASVDFTGLDAAVARLQGDAPAPSAPAVPADPSVPADGSAPADPNAPAPVDPNAPIQPSI